MFGTSVECYLVACRSKQGYDEWNQSAEEERDEVMARWYSVGLHLESKATRTRVAQEWDMAMRVLLDTHPHPKHDKHYPSSKHAAPEAPHVEDKIATEDFQEALHKATHLLSDLMHLYEADSRVSPIHEDEPTMDGIARAKSTARPADDAMFEQALRESIAETHKAEADGDSENAYSRAIQAGMEAAKRISRDGAAPFVAGEPIRPSASPEKETLEEQMGRLSAEERGKTDARRKSEVEAEADRLSEEGLNDVTEFAIWKTLTEQRRDRGGEGVD